MRRTQTADPATLLASEVATLATRLVTDAEQGGHIAAVAGEAAEQALRAFLDARLAAAENAAPRLSDWLLRVVRALTGIGPELRVGTPADGIELARTLLSHVGAAAQTADAAHIRPYVAELLQIVQVELGISLPTLETMVWQIVDDIADRLEALPPEPERAARENRRDTIRMLRRIKRLIRGKFPLPVIDADRVSAGIARTLRRLNADALGRKLACVSNGVGAIGAATTAIQDVVPLAVSQFGSLGAAAAATTNSGKYCWYASWLLGDDIVINGLRTAIHKGSDVIATGSNLTVADIPQFKSTNAQHYTFNVVDLDAMETMAYVAFVCSDALDLLLHLTSLEEGDYASNAFNALFFTFAGGSKIAYGRPVLSNTVETWVIPPLLSLITSFEGMHTKVNAQNWFAMWLTLMGPDVLETIIYRQVSATAREGLLSFFTLLNYKGAFQASGDPDTRPLNRQHINGVVAIPGIFIGMAQFALYPREEYAQPFQSSDHAVKFFLFWNLLVGTCFTLLNKLAGWLLAMAVGRVIDPKAFFDTFKMFGVPLLAIPVSWITWFISLYMSVEGDTDDGKYNPGGSAFAGYPAHDASPYTLPYPKDQLVYVGQANQGIFSHNVMNIQQTYSYDFSMDEGDIIVASRAGTVVDYFDWVANDINPDATQQAQAASDAAASGFLVGGQTTSDSWNFIAIRHDRDDAGNPLAPDATHDKGPGGSAVTTYAVYGHGRNGSVRELFGARGIAGGSIIGQPVKRGDRIMRAGDTGISFHNHLHMMVQAGPSSASAPPVSRFNLTTGTIPFVFKDVTHLIGRDGVCKNLNFYRSTTTDLQATP
ncbi:MAG TPA: hypothetical protein VF021_08910 [Longimicrobiales bacterium]